MPAVEDILRDLETLLAFHGGRFERSQLAANPDLGRRVGLDVQIRGAVRDAGLEVLAEDRFPCAGLSACVMVNEAGFDMHVDGHGGCGLLRSTAAMRHRSTLPQIRDCSQWRNGSDGS